MPVVQKSPTFCSLVPCAAFAFAAVFVLARWVRERPAPEAGRRATVRLAWAGLDRRFKTYLAVLVVFGGCRSSR
jgi:hypothetical protein